MSKIGSISDDLALAWKIGFTGKKADEVRHEVGWLIRYEGFFPLSLANLKAKRNNSTDPRSKAKRKDCLRIVCLYRFHSV